MLQVTGMAGMPGTNVHGDASKGQLSNKDSQEDKAHASGPFDELHRGNPRSSMEGFLSFAAQGNFKDAARYLDVRYLPKSLKNVPPEELARKLKIVLDRALWLDPESLSSNPSGDMDDGLPSYRDLAGRIKTPEGDVDILLQRVPRKDGILIWKISNRTVAKIPLLYKYFGYRMFEEKLSNFFPDVQLAGWQLWQWAFWFSLLAAGWVAAWLPTWIIAFFIRRRSGAMSVQLAGFVTGPLRLFLWMIMGRFAALFVIPSSEIRRLLSAGTLIIFASAWGATKVVDILFELWKQHMRKDGRESSTVLLNPLRTLLRVSIITVALLLWLDNIGFRVSALLAGLGVGGLAVALAAQGVLKNLLGTVMILADRPYNVGERIVVRGYDGEVEEIGLRSTKLRLLNGHLVSIPNDEMERSEIENIGRRPHIRRKQNIRLAIDTPPGKVDRAVEIIREILDNHEGMRAGYPPRVYFDRFRDDALNIVMFYWYHPAEYWDFLDFSQKINESILNALEKEGIRFALPARTVGITGAEGSPPVRVVNMVQDT